MACTGEISDKCRYVAATGARNACFDCSICLEPAVEPVVTLCGHLYCWPCIHKWMRVDGSGSASAPHCPVCRAPVSANALVALYARGVPSRPIVPVRERSLRYDRYVDGCCGSVLGSTGGGMLLGLAVAVSRSGDLVGPYRYRLDTSGSSFRERRQELAVEEALHQIWIFLFCCVVLCLLSF